jgi:diguanylate cyclase (GGDEF)-like protein
MDAVSAAYQSEAAAHAALPKALSGGFCLLTLLTLGALGLRASRPEAVAALVEMEEKKKEQDAALGEADRQIAEMRLTLENLSTIDALTGLSNHRAFQERLDREMGRALRHGQPLSLLLLDVDKFKSYNDSYGHTDGDQALKLIAEILKETARASDIPARYGGKEFALILTETDMMGAVVLGERLRQAVASADGLQRPLTASIGLATLNGNIFSAAALIAQADRALCHAKGDGRNRVSHAHRIPAPLEDEAPVYARAA